MNELRPINAVMLIVAALCALIPSLRAAQAAVALRAQDANTAQQIAETAPWPNSRVGKVALHPLGVQTLSVEKQEIKTEPNTPLVRVYQFSYSLQQSRLVVINTQSEAVVKARQLDTIHLPLNDTEIAYASTLLTQQPTVITMLREEQERRHLQAFKQLSELDVKASIYEPLDITHACHKQRCALMSLFDNTSTVFSVEPIINLQTMQVLLLNNP